VAVLVGVDRSSDRGREPSASASPARSTTRTSTRTPRTSGPYRVVAINLPVDDLKRIDAEAERRAMSRSDFLRVAALSIIEEEDA
jgi:hypothetical protein